LVKIPQPEEANNIKKHTNEVLLAKISQREDASPTLRRVLAVNKLANKDIILHTANESDKAALEQNTNWTTRIASSAKVHLKTYAVLVHGVKTASFGRDAGDKPMRELEKQNAHLHANMKIIRTSWITRPTDNRVFSSLIVEVDSATTANRMINEGVIHGCELKITKLYDRLCRIAQCYNYQKYGSHISKHCREKTKCGWCCGGHPTHECPSKGDKSKRHCAACKEKHHEAWSLHCSERKREGERADRTYENRRAFYPITAPINTPRTPPSMPTFSAGDSQRCRKNAINEKSKGE
jgi:hypothetical protein